MQGVSINIFIKKKDKETSPLAQVFYKDIYGSRKLKLNFLAENKLSTVNFQEIVPSVPLYIFRPHNNHLQEVYESGFKIDKLMINCVQGFKTDRDNLAIQYSKEDIENIAFDMLNTTLSDNDFQSKYKVKNNRDWYLSEARQRIRNKKNWNDCIIKIQYRPFDVCWTLFPNFVNVSPQTHQRTMARYVDEVRKK